VKQNHRRSLVVIILGFVALSLGGCVYLRLLELKNQLGDFDRFFEVDLHDGFKLTCKVPVLLDEDMAFFELVPEKKDQVGVAERWHFRWVKDYAVPGEDPAASEIAADFIFVDHKLNRIILPERLFIFIPKSALLTLLRAVGHANIDAAKRTANANYQEKSADAPSLPAAAEVTRTLGIPLEIKAADSSLSWRYRYHRASPDQHAGRIDMTFSFDPATRKIQRLKGRLFDVTMDFNFTNAAAAPAAAPAP
jgi:hypothetical protein